MQATFSSAFLRGDPRAALLFAADFRDRAARCHVARRAAQRTVSPLLIEELKRQEQALGVPKSPARDENLRALAEGGTAVVVTGQQVGLFLGPLYTIYKAASAIAAARAIANESGVRCVPLFWLQTEDHDFAEVNHCYVPRPGEPPLRLELPECTDAVSPERGRISVAHRPLGESITAQLSLLQEALADLPHAAEFLALLQKHYRKAASLGQAFAGVLAELFSDDGLLLLNPRPSATDSAIARLASPLYRQALRQHEAISSALLSRSAELRALGFDEQVRVRPDTALFFVHDRDETGPRYRPERTDSQWTICGRTFSDEDLLELLDRAPLRFSTSALLRPLFQDQLLPTVAYVGGPGEVSYLAQLGPLYRLLKIDQPLIVPRARFRCVDDKTRSLLRRIDESLTAADLEAPRAEVLRRLTLRGKAALPSSQELKERLLARIVPEVQGVAALDPSLRDAVVRTRQSIETNIDKLVEKYGRAILQKDSILAERVDKLQGFLFPNGAPQERVYSLPYFASQYGARTFIEKVLHELAAEPSTSASPGATPSELFSSFAQGPKELAL